jgi:dTDP-4-amino-4,6-dideoxygalactose transaminase
MIQIYQPQVGKEELEAIKDVFESNWIGKGPITDQFIKEWQSRLISDTFEGVAFAQPHLNNLTTINCCTEGLFQAMDLFGIEEGDEVILPSIHWVGAGNAIMYKKAIPVFCDVDKRTLNVNVDYIKEKITDKTKAVIVLHYAGVPCDIESIAKLCKEKNIILIEDNANSPLSVINGQSTGTFGDLGIWSFDAMKVITAIDGGLIYAKDPKNIEKLNKITYLGWDSSSSEKSVESKWWAYDVLVPGRRSIMNDVQSAIGLEQLKKSDSFIETRKHIHDRYTEELSKLEWLDVPPKIKRWEKSSYYMYHIQTKDANDRDKLAKHLRSNNIYTAFRYYPLHLIEYYNSNSILPNTIYASNHTLCIPLHQSLTDSDVTKVIKTIKKFK